MLCVAMLILAMISPQLAEMLRLPSAATPACDLLVSADTEGHVHPCRSCPTHVGLGGIDRRATWVRQQRAGAPVVLVDAGNFLFGSESLGSRGRIIVAAYEQLGYDAVNLSYRDFRLGKDATLEVLNGAKFQPVSANLLDDSTGRHIVAPFAVRSAGGLKLAIIGMTEPPAGFEHLPQLQQELAGIRIRPPAEALDDVLPQAKASADEVILLYYGSGAGLRTLLEKHPRDFAAACVGGIPADALPKDLKTPIISVEQHGKEMAALALPSSGTWAVTHRPIDDTLAGDPGMKALIAKPE